MSMTFDEIRLPVQLALGARGGPERRTEIVTLGSGFEHRNQLWAHSRRRWNVGYGIRTLAHLETILAFFEERRGRMRGFRFKDRLDFRSAAAGAATTATDQTIGEGDGATLTFQLCKIYGSGSDTYRRPIKKPVAGSVQIAVDGDAVDPADYLLDAATGLVTFDTAPANGAVVSAGFEFDVPVRFDTDFLEIDASAFEAGSVPDIPILEIRL